MHGSGQGVELCIVLPHWFIECAGANAQFVPKTIEINALAALHQARGVGTPKRKVPERMAAHDIVPRSHARQRSVDQDEFVPRSGCWAAKA